MLIENTLFGTRDKVAEAIQRLKSFEPEDGYYVAFGGGKDSIVVLDLVKRSGVKYDAHYTITSVDPPELIRYIRKHHPDVAMDFPWTPKATTQNGFWKKMIHFDAMLIHFFEPSVI